MPVGSKKSVLNGLVSGSASLRLLFEALPQGLILTDPEGGIIFCNQAQLKRDGLAAGAVLGRRLADVYPGAGWAETLSAGGPAWLGRYAVNGRQAGVSVTCLAIGDGRSPAGFAYLLEESDLPAATAKAADDRPSPEAAFCQLIGRCPGFKKALSLGLSAAASPSPVMLFGETGAGKDMFARFIHQQSPRAGGNFVAVNCSAIPQDLLEGLMFGTTKGAFTGAAEKKGLFEEANGGTLFLDELDSMPLKLQPKLLRVLQERKIRRVGAARELDLDIKIISAVSGSPADILKSGRLRSDLFYRLGVMVIGLPPLRERLDDLPLFIDHFVAKHNRLLGRQVRAFAPEVVAAFKEYTWPGNVRELEHIIEAALNVAGGEEIITPEMLPDHFSLSAKITLGAYQGQEAAPGFDDEIRPPDDLITLKDREKSMIARSLFLAGGNVAQAARMLDISRQLLVYKMKKYGLDRSQFKN